MTEIESKEVRSIPGIDHPLMNVNWIDEKQFVGVDRRSIKFWSDPEQAPNVVPLPYFQRMHFPAVGAVSRGMNAKHRSPSGRYLIQPTSVLWDGRVTAGDMNLFDLETRSHLWTGVAFTDGIQARVEPTGRILGGSADIDKYLNYVITYPCGRMLALTKLQFASRIGSSPAQQLIQKVVDLGGTIRTESKDYSGDIRDARKLPRPDQVIEIDLSGVSYQLDKDLLKSITEFPTLASLIVQGPNLDETALRPISKVRSLRRLSVSRSRVGNTLGQILPDGIEQLDVSETNIGDFFVADLKKRKSLRKINLTGSKATPKAVQQLRDALPDCDVDYETAGD